MNKLQHATLAALACLGPFVLAQSVVAPHLEKRGQATQLIVEGKPYLVLGGELHNSSSSSVDYMQPVFRQMAAMHLNTLLLPVAWETIEPEEGKFDFQNVDGLIEGARANNLKIVFLWFGAWKNTFSSYTPAWVKSNVDRFPRVQTTDGRGTERLSPFSTPARDADAKAFVALMRHIKQVDSDKHTVLMMQVENEVGVLPQSRDHSAVAEAAFNAQVPAQLLRYLQDHHTNLNPYLRTVWEGAGAKTSGTWQQLFGTGSITDDLFMAWHYATYIEHVTAAGKAEYNIPMFTNAALIRPNYEPGQYNSGGPLYHSFDIWRAAGPALDFLSPDIYFNEFTLWAGRYSNPTNPLFIPETQGGVTGAANALYAFGHLKAIGFSPFGIDDLGNAPLDLAGITHGEHPDNNAMGDAYLELSHLAPLILEKQSSGGINAAVMEGEAQRAARVNIGDYTANISRAGNAPATSRNSVMFIQTAPNEWLVTGAGDSQINFTSDKPGPPIVGIESIDEIFYKDGKWIPGRRMNGDENSQGQALRIYATDMAQGRIYKLRLYRYR